MSFWTKSTGEQTTGKVVDNSFDDSPAPEGWQRVRLVDVGDKEDKKGNKFINLRTQIVGGDLNKKTVFVKLKVYPQDSEYYKEEDRDKALDKLMKLCDLLKIPRPEKGPNDAFFARFTDKEVEIKFGIWKNDEKVPQGNFIRDFSGIGEKAGTAKAAPKPAQQQRPAPQPRQAPGFADMDDDIPFNQVNWRAV